MLDVSYAILYYVFNYHVRVYDINYGCVTAKKLGVSLSLVSLGVLRHSNIQEANYE